MEIMILAWSIWSLRNDQTFRGIRPVILRCNAKFKEELAMVVQSRKKK
jgi:hypothetical protein